MEDLEKKRNEMIEEILQYSDVFDSARELDELSFSKIESIYKTCLIPLLKKLKKQKI
ncbi:MAG: hypothetical protein R3277_12155 [Brumimicrobium sp.]|nr:hypothetical protein [Brumimicrobium sp.]